MKLVSELSCGACHIRCHEENNPVRELSVQVNHQLNTPLGIAVTALSSMQEKLEKAPSRLTISEIKQCIELSQNNINKAIDSLSGLKRFTERAQLGSEQVELKTLIEKVVLTVKTKHFHTKAEVCIACPSELSVQSCNQVFQSVFENLIDNAFSHAFMNSNGDNKLTISVAFDAKKNEVLFFIKDNGHGLPLHSEQELKTAYFTTNREEKHGLGLFETNYLIEKVLGGSFSIVNRARFPGTVVKVTLPMRALTQS